MFGMLADHTDLSLAATDADGRLNVMTGPLRDLYGSTGLGTRDVDMPEVFGLYDADGAAPLAADDVPLLRARRGEVVRDAVVSGDVGGQMRFFRVNAVPICEGSDIIGAVSLTQDVTPDRAARLVEQELRERLVNVVNHELRTPVSKLLGFVEMLPDTLGELTPEQARLLGGIQAAVEDLRVLTDMVSALAELHAVTVADFVDADVTPCVVAAVDATKPAARRKHVSLRLVECPDPDATRCRVDPDLLRRAVRALTTNAVVYAPAGSTVDIELCLGAAELEVVVSDTGPTEHRRGGGLGLDLAETVARAHHGRLELEPNQPHGMRAHLVLPRPLTR